MILLDTHVWLWTVEGDDRRLGRRARALLTRAESEGAIRISAASVFEVAALHTAGRLRLSRPLQTWIEDALASPAARLAPVSAAIGLDAGTIPRGALADPLDRLLVATARHLDAALLTADEAILEYATNTRNLRAVRASA